MPGPDEIRRHQEEHPISPAMKELLQSIPKAEPFDINTTRRKLAEEFRRQAQEKHP